MEESKAIVGISFSDKIIYNVLEGDSEFAYAGETFISNLRNNRNHFLGKIMESQSYNLIDFEGDDLVLLHFISENNKNECYFSDIHRIMYSEVSMIEFFYIYDVFRDVILVKTPELFNPMLVEYSNDEDLDYFRQLLEE